MCGNLLLCTALIVVTALLLGLLVFLLHITGVLVEVGDLKGEAFVVGVAIIGSIFGREGGRPGVGEEKPKGMLSCQLLHF
jgi:hypothetical protein